MSNSYIIIMWRVKITPCLNNCHTEMKAKVMQKREIRGKY